MDAGTDVCIDIGSNGDSLREGDSLRDGRGWEDIFRNGSVVVCWVEAARLVLQCNANVAWHEGIAESQPLIVHADFRVPDPTHEKSYPQPSPQQDQIPNLMRNRPGM